MITNNYESCKGDFGYNAGINGNCTITNSYNIGDILIVVKLIQKYADKVVIDTINNSYNSGNIIKAF